MPTPAIVFLTYLASTWALSFLAFPMNRSGEPQNFTMRVFAPIMVPIFGPGKLIKFLKGLKRG